MPYPEYLPPPVIVDPSTPDPLDGPCYVCQEPGITCIECDRDWCDDAECQDHHKSEHSLASAWKVASDKLLGPEVETP